MQTETLFYIIISGIIALLVALFQYKYKSKYKGKLTLWFVLLRFLSVFAVLLLLINPKFNQTRVYLEKPKLLLAVDNSNSIIHLKQEQNALSAFNEIKQNKALNDVFDVEIFAFDEAIENIDSFNFKSKASNIDKALRQLSDIYKNDIAPIILVSDGNQTFGNDYAVSTKYTKPVYPLLLGDTITYNDLKIQQLNVNKYAFLKNNFPVEGILVYQGNEQVNTKFEIKRGSQILYSKTLRFSQDDNSKVINITLPANSVGIQSYKAYLQPLANEKNVVNNTKNFAVEVIDEKTKIALVSDFPHPDLGAIKKSIESNEQRSVDIIDSQTILNQINDFQLIIMYQPNSKFKALYELIDKDRKNTFTIIGTKTNLGVINSNESQFNIEITGQEEDFQGTLNINYNSFLVDDINFESFPPLKGPFGKVEFTNKPEVMLEKTVLGISKSDPLLATFEIGSKKEAVLFGENIWQWRAQSFLNETTFNPFDNFMGKLVQYLASNKLKSRLDVYYETFYTGSANILITAQAFDKSYQFDTRQSLELHLEHTSSKEMRIVPLLLKNNNYQVDLSGLQAGKYSFKVLSKSGDISKSGNFEVLEYNIEAQFLNADVKKLKQLATNTKGKLFFSNNTNQLISELLNNESYKPIQKSDKNTVPLIDWKYLLGLIVFTLSVEWFLRKYNGLI